MLSSKQQILTVLIAASIPLFCGACSNQNSEPGSFAANSQYSPDSTDHKLLTLLDQSLDNDRLKSQLLNLCEDNSLSVQSRQQACYVLANILSKSQNLDEQKSAIELYEQAANYAPLKERSNIHIAEISAAVGQESQARLALAEVKKSSNDKNVLSAIDYGLAQSYLRANETDKARSCLEQIRQLYPTSQYALGAAYYLGQLDFDHKENDSQVLDLWREYLSKSPDGRFAFDIVNQLSGQERISLDKNDFNHFAMVHYLHGNWSKALSFWQKGNPDRYWYQRALCFRRLNNKEECRKILSKGVAEHPNDPLIPDAAKMLSKLLSKQEAIQLWQGVYGSSNQFKDVALWNIAARYELNQAITYYKQIIQKYPQSAYAAESTWWIFWHLYKNNQWTQADKYAQQALTNYRQAKSASRFAYWRGKCAERLRQPGLAIKQYKQVELTYPGTYYAHRAKSRLSFLSGHKDNLFSSDIKTNADEFTWNWPEPYSQSQVFEKFGATIACLIRLHQFEECLAILPDDSPAILRSWLMAKLNLPLEAINIANSTLTGLPNRSPSWQIAYPRLYSQYISKNSSKEHLNPYLVHALIREESRYNKLALSTSNALGLMQLLPGTAYGVAKRLNIPLQSQSSIYKPEINIALGTAYLGYTLSRFKTYSPSVSPMLAVASYNGGPNAVAGWARKKTSDWDAFVEDIPFNETRDYVRKVFNSYWNYKEIYK